MDATSEQRAERAIQGFRRWCARVDRAAELAERAAEAEERRALAVEQAARERELREHAQRAYEAKLAYLEARSAWRREQVREWLTGAALGLCLAVVGLAVRAAALVLGF